jgi:hypothetical protein
VAGGRLAEAGDRHFAYALLCDVRRAHEYNSAGRALHCAKCAPHFAQQMSFPQPKSAQNTTNVAAIPALILLSMVSSCPFFGGNSQEHALGTLSRFYF